MITITLNFKIECRCQWNHYFTPSILRKVPLTVIV